MIHNTRWLRAGLWLFSAGIGAVIMAVSVMPEPPTPVLLDDRVAHALAYAVLVPSVLMAGVWAPGLGEGRWPAGAVVVVGMAIVVGALIEILQGAYFERTPDGLDALANAVGASAGGLSWRGLRVLVES